ncbi:tryptophanase [Natronobacterium gregoryi]|uniref:Tryptophanase n=2 Tax=Natronobacterium gregoryi TaxID=44930 RepID=L0AH83_NATGS|nr:tryptophanase [Natronobacterium gregoryi]AFZ72794.1 tryptophanase [Natronobacterium gregoryi SP2]ELY69441.1 tryptophanase/L-cysteine desulfhydrase, PLP-dependent [Natronobacterium gregoryi SP2]PLK21134.1 tyrosine phenol-lyase [Natronobacterium gregoryi SP2]SFJ10594.1 tryptophanase [Natronobacterium gregoryi]
MVAYKTKMVERISLPAREQREQNLESAGYNAFNLDADDVFVDLLTDSGTGAMSDAQWAALVRGDEAYAGSRSFDELESAVGDVMGFDHVVPAHQGRGAENVLYGALLEEGDVVPNNTHFDTTRAHVANQGADPVDCPVPSAHDPDVTAPFKGNFSLERGRELVDEVGADSVPVVVQTITNNSAAGQPVSVENTRRVRAFADEIDARFVIDACRFAENAYFVKQREEEFAAASIAEIAHEQLGYADAVVMSGKKDGLVNAGGFVATDDARLYERSRQRAILYEGFPTYGGMAGRDVAALAVGLREAVDSEYLADRIEQIEEFGSLLEAAGVPIYRPVGGHAVYLDAGAALSHLPDEAFPGQALVCELYREGGVRGVELGSFAFPDTDRPELVRLAVPRRTYHREHFEHVADTVEAVLEKGESVPGLELATEPEMPEIRHFTAELEPLS